MILFLLLGLAQATVYGQCTDCAVMICDGITCDDGTSADGVQTSRKCGCGQAIGGACAIVEINLSGNPYYDPTDPDCKLVFTTQEQGNFFIYFTDENCGGHDCSTPDFNVKSGEPVTGFPESGSFKLMVCKDGGNAGRRDFSFTISCSTVENCVNGIDDNNDGLIDCDDGSCAKDSHCTFTETSSGNDGGLESNSRLAQKIAGRQYYRERTREDMSSPQSPEKRFVKKWKGSARTKSFDPDAVPVRELIPDEAIPGTETYISSPTDLIGITNASEVFSIDVFRQESRIASIFATRSQEGVYEHTKFICDRLHGARIEQVWEYPMDGQHPFIVTKFQRAGGITEYACNFSFFQFAPAAFQLESHWNISDYTPDETYINFQVWANNMQNLQDLVREILFLIQERGVIERYHLTKAPQVFVSGLDYEQGRLSLDLINRNGSTALDLRGEYAATETTATQALQYRVSLNGDENERIDLETGSLYNLGLSLQDGYSEVADGVYIADGAWGVDYQIDGAAIAEYEVRPGEHSVPTDGYAIERNISLSGTVSDYVAAYRSLNPAFRPVDMSQYNLLRFNARGSGDLEVTIVREGVKEWDKQMKTAIRLEDDQFQDIELPLHRFFAPDTDLEWTDIKMIVFSLRGDGQSERNFELEIGEVAFKWKKDLTSGPERYGAGSTVTPNPLVDQSSILFRTEQSSSYTFQLFTAAGVVLQEQRGRTTTGTNELKVTNNDYLPGIYLYNILLSSGEVLSGKIMVQDRL